MRAVSSRWVSAVQRALPLLLAAMAVLASPSFAQDAAAGPNACIHANDGMCDEPDYCQPGTDTADCSAAPANQEAEAGVEAGGPESCPFSNDGECDEPDFCAPDTDTTDCTNFPRQEIEPVTGPDACMYANDGMCDEPDYCPVGTDTTDCNMPGARDAADGFGGMNSCPFANDGFCDEPDMCMAGTDTNDCQGGMMPGAGGGFGAGVGGLASAALSVSPLDMLLELIARVIAPFLALMAVQSLTVFLVLRYMMRKSSDDAEQEDLAPLPSQPAGSASGGGLGFAIRSHIDEVSRFETPRARLKRLFKGRRQGRISAFVALSVFLIASLIATGAIQIVALQAIVALVLFIVFVILDRPVGIVFAVIASAVLLAPAIVLHLMHFAPLSAITRSAIALGVLALIFAFSIWRNRATTARLGKQDLLVLRVFGMDRTAKETFTTIARAWSYQGASATIADPSYIKFQFSGFRGQIWRFILVVLAGALAFGAAQFAFVTRLVPASLTAQQQEWVLMTAALFALLPIVAIPVFISVRMNFASSLQAILSRIDRTMGSPRRRIGYYPRRAFFCHDDLWRPAIQAMMNEAEVVLLDFRGFEPKNLGCAYEIGKVLDSVDIRRAVLLLDAATEKEVLFDIFQTCWSKMASGSPNYGRSDGELKVFIAHRDTPLRGNILDWLWARLTLRRTRKWAQDSRGILAQLTTAPLAPDQAFRLHPV